MMGDRIVGWVCAVISVLIVAALIAEHLTEHCFLGCR
jgi:hypothetical protein